MDKTWFYLLSLIPNIKISKINKRLFYTKYMRVNFGSGEVIAIRSFPVKVSATYKNKQTGKVHSIDLINVTFPPISKIRIWMESKWLILVKIKVGQILIDGKVFYES